MAALRYDVVILGAGAAGLMCAIEAGRRGRSVLLIDHAKAPAEKVRISGGGRCNFTNLKCGRENFISQNPRFALSALKRFTPNDFIARVAARGIAYHEKTLGQLFCDGSSKEIIAMLDDDRREAGVDLWLHAAIEAVTRGAQGFRVETSEGPVEGAALVLATGGKSIPKMGATGLAYRIAEQFGLRLTETRPALVPLTFDGPVLEAAKTLSGLSVDAVISNSRARFREGMLFTHRGLSGPSILQLSSYWREGEEIEISMAPDSDVLAAMKAARGENGRQTPGTALSTILPRRLAQSVAERAQSGPRLADLSDKRLRGLEAAVNGWCVTPAGSEGYRTAEVTLGGVDTRDLDAKTMQARAVPDLYVIGEAVDVTGWLGGYNFQWAWASGWAAGQVV